MQLFLNFDFECNGPIDKVTFECKNEQGIFRQVIGTKIEKDTSTENLYHVSVPVPANELPINIRANANNALPSDIYTITRSGVAARLDNRNVFATHTTFSVRCGHNTTDHAGNSTVLISTRRHKISPNTPLNQLMV